MNCQLITASHASIIICAIVPSLYVERFTVT